MGDLGEGYLEVLCANLANQKLGQNKIPAEKE